MPVETRGNSGCRPVPEKIQKRSDIKDMTVATEALLQKRAKKDQ